MQFIPNSPLKQQMVHELGLKNINDLFSDIPKTLRTPPLSLPKGDSQQHVEEHMRRLAERNTPFHQMPSFLGGGMKPHYIPAAVKAVLSRSEFYTAYTPYQPEASQGFLQAIFEYQSMVAELTGMDVSNASVYDGGTALGEAALMATRLTRKKTFIIPGNISWEKKSILMNYTRGAGILIRETKYDAHTGTMDIDDLTRTIDVDTAGVYLENPNFFGVFEDAVDDVSRLTHQHHSLFVVGADPLSLGIVKSPGDYGADIVIGEGKSLGNPLDCGGSTLGLFACKSDHVRQLPGRIIGMTKDTQGKRAFCMTMQTREQHIRREKATSNICTNEGLNMLAAAVYLSLLGSTGLKELSLLNFTKAQDLAQQIAAIPGFTLRFSGVHFNEFVIHHQDAVRVQRHLLSKGIQGGLPLHPHYPALKDCLLFGVTEMHTKEHVEHLLSLLKEVS
ncbi:MAG: aminomethyl-transferring glycine dehydrogenase subunit GcvPA [Candidatus Thermoplasmatota archaeon]|nr:aminomethyl-transferring glycine dehydrogenase subunit GcvPA [Candidatus Thermoplasmatota archaeon]